MDIVVRCWGWFLIVEGDIITMSLEISYWNSHALTLECFLAAGTFVNCKYNPSLSHNEDVLTLLDSLRNALKADLNLYDQQKV